jgi:hypothetical protein
MTLSIVVIYEPCWNHYVLADHVVGLERSAGYSAVHTYTAKWLMASFRAGPVLLGTSSNITSYV